MKYKNIQAVFDDELKHIKFDRSFVNAIRNIAKRFMTKNPEHVRFFGDGLIGAHRITFTNEDRTEFFDDVLDFADYHSIRDNLWSLSSINKAYKVSSDVMNNTIMYLVHRLAAKRTVNGNKVDLSPSEIEEAQKYLLYFMHYRFLCSLQTHYFPHLADPNVSRATFSELSNKFDIKTAGSWQKWIEQRVADIMRRDGLHAKTIERFTDDDAIVKMVNDIQGRVRQTYKNIAEVFYRVYEGANKINSTSALMEGEDGMVLKDQINNYSTYRRYISDTIPEPSAFIRNELVDVIQRFNSSMPEDAFKDALDYLSDNYQSRRSKVLQPMVDEIIIHALNFINTNKIPLNDLQNVLVRLRSTYTSSGTSDKNLLDIKEGLNKELRYAVEARRYSAIPAIRTGLMLYVVLRTLTMKHYQS